MESKKVFLRYARVTFFSKTLGIDRVILASGLKNSARVSFKTEEELDETMTTAEINIFNLSREDQKDIRESEYIMLQAGTLGSYDEFEDMVRGLREAEKNDDDSFDKYKNEDLIFSGQVYSISNRYFIDNETTIFAASKKPELDAYVSIGLRAGATLENVLSTVEAFFKSKYKRSIDFTRKNFTSEELAFVYTRGYSFFGKLSKFIDQIGFVFDKHYFVNQSVIDKDKKGKNEKDMIVSFSDRFDILNEEGNNEKYPIVAEGFNLIAADYSSRERDFREAFFRERIPNNNPKAQGRRKLSINTISLSTYLNPAIKLGEKLNVARPKSAEKALDSKVNSPKGEKFNKDDFKITQHKIKELTFVGDTHGRGDEWRCEVVLFDELKDNALYEADQKKKEEKRRKRSKLIL